MRRRNSRSSWIGGAAGAAQLLTAGAAVVTLVAATRGRGRASAAPVGAGGGLITFLRTDIEGSCRLYQRGGELMYPALDAHDSVLVDGIRRHRGVIEKNEGDSFFAIFARPTQAVAAAFEIQRDLDARLWPRGHRPRVRMGIHTGEAGRQSPSGKVDVRGLQANICGRVSDLARGDQVLLTMYTALFAKHELPTGAALRDLGWRVLRDVSEPQHIYELVPEADAGTGSEKETLISLSA
jgi:class 3 adenylate cyclase